MSVSDINRFDELVSRYLDASLEPVEERQFLEYLSDQGLASRFFEATRLNAEIGGLLAGSMPNEVMIDLVLRDLAGTDNSLSAEPAMSIPIRGRATPQRHTGLLLALSAMVIGLISVMAVFHFRASVPVTGGEITDVSGEVSFTNSSGQVLLNGSQTFKGQGTIKTVGPDSRATIALNDGTRIDLMGETSFTAGFFAEKRKLLLDRGTLRSIVSKQPEGAPLVFNTPQSVITVRGTQLVIVAETSQTYLIVTKGVVALRRSSGGPEVLIETGHYGHVEEGGTFRPWPINRLPKELRDLAEPLK